MDRSTAATPACAKLSTVITTVGYLRQWTPVTELWGSKAAQTVSLKYEINLLINHWIIIQAVVFSFQTPKHASCKSIDSYRV